MKKTMIGILVIALCLLIGAQTVFAGTCGTNVKYTISGDTINFSKRTSGSKAVWGADCGDVFFEEPEITKVNILNKISVTDGNNMFSSFEYVEEMDLSNLDVSAVTDMRYMFHYCIALRSVNVSGWDTSKVTLMEGMFDSCESLKSLNLSSWDTSAVKNMRLMFAECSSLTTLNISGWNTSNVTKIDAMFTNCSSLKKLDLSGWNTAKVTAMDSVFTQANKLNTLVLGKNTLKKNIFKTLPKYNASWYYVKAGAAAGSPLAQNTVKKNGALFTGYQYNTMAGIWATVPGAKSITIKNEAGDVFNGKNISSINNPYQCTASAEPAKASQSFTWISSDKNIATVSSTGKITFKEFGKVKITVKAKDGSGTSAYFNFTMYARTKKITIKNGPGYSVNGRSLTTSKKTYQFSASASPADAMQRFTWTTSNTAIATVDSTGKVTYKKAGTVTITAKAKDGTGVKASFKLTYKP